MLDRATELADLYLAANRATDALTAYRRAEAKCGSRRRSAMAATRAAEVLADSLNRPAEAEKEFRRVLAEYAGAPKEALRDAHIGLGNVACRRGDTDAALTAFRAAEAISVGGLASKNPTLRVSSLARYVEEYIRTRDFESADEFVATWYREFPSERVNGRAPLLEARLRHAQERYEEVLRIAGELVGVNRDSPFAADLLMLSAEASLKLNRRLDARRALAQVVDDYPESPRHAEAGELLRKLGGPPPEP